MEFLARFWVRSFLMGLSVLVVTPFVPLGFILLTPFAVLGAFNIVQHIRSSRNFRKQLRELTNA